MDNNENNVESSLEDSDSDDDCGSYSTPPEYEPSPPRSRRRPDEDDPESDPTADHQDLLGICFRNWRSTLNKEYVQKSKNARDDFEFKQQKNTPEAKALSEENTVKATKAAKNPHHLGVGGYAAKITKWRRDEEERKRASLPDMFAGLDERRRNWAQKKCLFRSDREKDQLTTAIGTAEHSGHKNLKEKMREIAKQEFLEFLANHAMSQMMADPTVSDGQRQDSSSSASSIENVRYPVDNIQVDTPCRLVIPYGRKQNKFREVATGMEVTGHSCEIDIPTDEGIEVLGDAKNQYILWHHRDIVMNASPETSRPSQELPLSSSNVDTEQPMLSHVQGANNEDEEPMLSPILEALNEDDGTSSLELHGWIMNAMKQGIRAIAVHVPTKVFLGILPYQNVIDFEDLHRLYHRQHLNVNLISDAMEGEELTHVRFKVAYLDPARIREPEHRLKMMEMIEAQIEAVETQAEKDAIKKAHREQKHKVSVYIAKVMTKKAHKYYIMALMILSKLWICIIILPKLGEAVVLDSASYHRDRYKDFIGIIQK
uniref:Uncharacterized protein n=1 Tax=Setaria italica TaxID=4555 RepID=K3YLQ7_SETIT